MILHIGLLSSIDRRIEFIIWGKIQLRVYSEIRHASHKNLLSTGRYLII